MRPAHELEQLINEATCELNKTKTRTAAMNEAFGDIIITKIASSDINKWSLNDNDTVELTVNITGKLFKECVDLIVDVDIDQRHLNALRNELADVLEAKAKTLRQPL